MSMKTQVLKEFKYPVNLVYPELCLRIYPVKNEKLQNEPKTCRVRASAKTDTKRTQIPAFSTQKQRSPKNKPIFLTLFCAICEILCLRYCGFKIQNEAKIIDTNSPESYNGFRMKGAMKAIDLYRQLRYQTDQLTADLEKIHTGRMVCQKGCCQCCTNLTVFPVEFFSIVQEMKQAGWSKLTFDAARNCGYLNEQGECEIYPFRPIICLTQGLPLAFYDDDAHGFSVTFCPLNFTDDTNIPAFNAQNTLNLDKLNDKLFEIHLQFLSEHPQMNLNEKTRIELRQLRDYL